jgi:hypothetical protein
MKRLSQKASVMAGLTEKTTFEIASFSLNG